jgi:hypothetical protein
MFRKKLVVLSVFCLMASGISGILQASTTAIAQEINAVGVPVDPLPEAEDFAVLRFGDAWDMDKFSDVSQYLNGAGRNVILNNPQVSGGLFSATSIGDRFANLAYFFPLFPGYSGFMQIGGNLGSQHEIDTSAFRCFYIAMRAQSPASVPQGPDSLRVLWYTDQTLQPQGQAPNGGTNEVRLYPETLSGSPLVHNWKLYKVDLANPPNGNLPGWARRPGWA